MSPTAPPPTSGAGSAATSGPPPDGAERRSLVIAGAAFFGVLVVLIGIVALVAGGSGDERTPATTTVACAPDDAPCRAAQRSSERPGIIPRPGEGHEPQDSGDPGGWAQLALFGVLVVALGGIVGVVVRSGRRARAAATDPGP